MLDWHKEHDRFWAFAERERRVRLVLRLVALAVLAGVGLLVVGAIKGDACEGERRCWDGWANGRPFHACECVRPGGGAQFPRVPADP